MADIAIADANATPDFAVVIIGTGFSGLGMAIRLKQQGRSDFAVFEREAGLGGAWYANTYPGCACDVPSHLYSFSFEPNPAWSRLFSPQAEIKTYLERCADKYDVRKHIRFNSEIVEARFDEPSGLWRVGTANGETVTARSVVAGLGPLSRPAFPDIPGIAQFKGKIFHSQQWDHGYDLSGKRVASIGTGASAIQFVPEIAPKVAQLHLFQRTPPWIVPKPDKPISEKERAQFRRHPGLQRFARNFIYWFLELRVFGFVLNPKLLMSMQRQGERLLQKQIQDPALRAKLTPSYALGCKRVLISNNYYPALNRSNVTLHTIGIREFTANGLTTSEGHELALDAVILGTGFHVTDGVPKGMIFGRGGRDLVDAWAEGTEAYKGTTIAGYPNFYLMTGANTGVGHTSLVFMIECQLNYVLDGLKTLAAKKLKFMDVRPQVQRAFNQRLQARMSGTIWNTGGCKSWYFDKNGKNATQWPGFSWQFHRQTRRFDAAQYEQVPLSK